MNTAENISLANDENRQIPSASLVLGLETRFGQIIVTSYAQVTMHSSGSRCEPFLFRSKTSVVRFTSWTAPMVSHTQLPNWSGA